jgi:redox-sensitive bicupin YhaK (pirin superfamily)
MTTPARIAVERVVPARRQTEGGGFSVRRPFPSPGIDQVDPFLLLDEMGPADYGPGEAVGAPDHPHRGFETVTYMLEGVFEHADSAGHRGRIEPGDVQWMTAGEGVVHSELPSREILRDGGRVHGFQLWVNLPARDKRMRPRYQELSADRIPKASTADGLARAVVVAGIALDVHAAIDTRIPILFHDWTVQPGGSVDLEIPPDFGTFAYVFSGSVQLGATGRTVRDGEMALLSPGELLEIRKPSADAEAARFLLLGAVPLREPMARYGPFVMNTRSEIEEAFADYQAGRLGRIPAA